MMRQRVIVTVVFLAILGVAGGVVLIQTGEFTKTGQERWQNEFMSVVEDGRALWVSGDLGTNGVACAQCHPNAANTQPETYPKFQQQLGRVIALRDMINWCLQNPLEGATLELDDPRMIAIEACIAYERRGAPMEPGKH